MPVFEFNLDFRVRYVETDAMGIVWHGNYFSYFEVARTEALRNSGMPSYRELEAAGILMPVVEVGATFLSPARYDDLLRIHLRVETPPRARIRFDYVITRGETRIAEGFTVLAFMDAATRRPCRPPKALQEFFA